MRENYTSAMLSSAGLQQFTYEKFAAKIQLPYGQGMWPAWWILGNCYKEFTGQP
jgi:beta-glucanase (GH16 family)